MLQSTQFGPSYNPAARKQPQEGYRNQPRQHRGRGRDRGHGRGRGNPRLTNVTIVDNQDIGHLSAPTTSGSSNHLHLTELRGGGMTGKGQ
ncbi:hypothetical protein PBY51_002299 [Eleginops maclovinus]|uniref:Uncharacterized protein n=1 Tax=Eleginops maclovinus TaxID=56733 RepID=A0AAN8AFM1_ELEMC|nr:hypothetical protein PBY51_002299 [Eleginops maclovinus]